jgi:hypothetical protein
MPDMTNTASATTTSHLNRIMRASLRNASPDAAQQGDTPSPFGLNEAWLGEARDVTPLLSDDQRARER